MKIVPLNEAKARLSHYGRACKDEPVVVTVSGKPAFLLVSLAEEDDLIDRLIADHPGFRAQLQKRIGESSMSTEEALRRLETAGRKPAAGKRIRS